MARCTSEIAVVETQLPAGHTDLQGWCLALSDWSAKLRLLRQDPQIATVAPPLANVRTTRDLWLTGSAEICRKNAGGQHCGLLSREPEVLTYKRSTRLLLIRLSYDCSAVNSLLSELAKDKESPAQPQLWPAQAHLPPSSPSFSTRSQIFSPAFLGSLSFFIASTPGWLCTVATGRPGGQPAINSLSSC